MQSGKNRVLITRTGHRYPPKRFAEWRDKMVDSLEYQIATGCGRKGVLFCTPVRVSLTVHYTPGDKIRRDVPGILDALCHVLERAGVVEDDAQIKEVLWKELALDRETPMAELTLTPVG